MKELPKKIHVIGICGVATSALAVAFHNAGSKVSGSDKGFFPPVSTELEKHGIYFYAGWHPLKMTENGMPDAVIIGTASGSENPETAFAKENNIPSYSFAEAIGQFFAKDISVVCSGTWGKTSSTALLSFILMQAKMDPTYMFGGISLSHESSAELGKSNISIFEGDEYKSSPTDLTAKFHYYKATHLLLSAVSWDHADLYPTEKLYFEAFQKLIDNLGNKGFIVGCADHEGVDKVLASYQGKKILYGREGNSRAQYKYSNVYQDMEGLHFNIKCDKGSFDIQSQMFGLYQSENITGCFAMAVELGVDPRNAVNSIASFKGLKRRMEKRLKGEITVFDDIAHSPEKTRPVLDTLKRVYKGNIYAVFEPNTGGRRTESLSKYDHAFEDAHQVIIPRLTKLKQGDPNQKPLEGEELSKYISNTHKNVLFMENDDSLVSHLVSTATKDDVIVFMGSHGFRGMIEATIALLKQKTSNI